MRAARDLLLLLLALVAVLGTGPRARGEDAATVVAADRTIAGCWTAEHGNPAGTGAVPTPGIRAPFVMAWTHETDGVIEEAPRVWRDLVVLGVRLPGDRRALHVLSLGAGEPLAEPLVLDTYLPLEPCLWNEVILVREGAQRLTAYRLEDGALASVWSVATDGVVHASVFHDDRMYAVEGESVVHYRLGDAEPLWRLAGTYRGGLALRGDTLYALSVDEAGNIELVAIDTGAGRPLAKRFIGHWKQDGVPPPGVIGAIAALEADVFVRHARSLKTAEGAPANTSWIRPRRSGTIVIGLEDQGLFDHAALPVAALAGWLVGERSSDGLQLVQRAAIPGEPGRIRGPDLADGKRNPDFLAGAQAISVAGTVAYAGGRAFDLETKRVVWNTASDPVLRPVPASDTLLVVPAADRLEALREAGSVDAGALFLGPARALGTPEATAPLAVDGTVHFADGSSHEGPYEIAADGRTVALHRGRGRKSRGKAAIGSVRLLLDADERLLYVSMPALLGPALERYHHLLQADAYVDLARDAYRTYDPSLLQRLIDEAAARGASEKELAHPRKQVSSLEARPRKHDEARRGKILEREQALAREAKERIEKTLASVLDDPRWEVQKAFARRLLAGNPGHERAVALVRGRLPDFLPLPEEFDARAWIDLVDALHHVDVGLLEPPAGESPDLTRLEREYGSALFTWRKDLVALEAAEIMILTPLARPGRIAGCLSMGTLVCRALDEVFRTGTAVRTDPYPMIMRLYETKQEYIASSLPSGSSPADEDEERKDLEWTLGHYDPQSGITRAYLPEDRDAWRSVMSTYAHELTHHWIEERCPLFEAREVRSAGGVPGYWIVEGMAVLLQEFRWDLERRTWETGNPRARSLDVVANAAEAQLIPWERLYALNAFDFRRLSTKGTREIPMRWRLGYHHVVSDKRIFYDQAAATSHYLYHAGEKERQALLALVRAHYTGTMPESGDAIQAIVGVPARELGRRVVAFAREQNRLPDPR